MKILSLLEQGKATATGSSDRFKPKSEGDTDLPANWIESLRLLVARERNGDTTDLQGGEYLAAEALLGFAELDSGFSPSPLVAKLLAGILSKAEKAPR